MSSDLNRLASDCRNHQNGSAEVQLFTMASSHLTPSSCVVEGLVFCVKISEDWAASVWRIAFMKPLYNARPRLNHRNGQLPKACEAELGPCRCFTSPTKQRWRRELMDAQWRKVSLPYHVARCCRYRPKNQLAVYRGSSSVSNTPACLVFRPFSQPRPGDDGCVSEKCILS